MQRKRALVLRFLKERALNWTLEKYESVNDDWRSEYYGQSLHSSEFNCRAQCNYLRRINIDASYLRRWYCCRCCCCVHYYSGCLPDFLRCEFITSSQNKYLRNLRKKIYRQTYQGQREALCPHTISRGHSVI